MSDAPLPEELFGNTITGYVRSWRPPWGWIVSPDFSGDIFAHKEDLLSESVKAGSQVKFVVGVEDQTGKPRALEIEVIGFSPEFARRKLPGSAKKKVGSDTFEGTVDKWIEKWGWISSPALGDKNIFGHIDDTVNKEPLQPGASVSFVLGEDNKGRERALEIEVIGGGVQDDVAETFSGKIKSWKGQWGWITCSKVDEGDIFAHVDEVLSGRPPAVGSVVQFRLGTDDKGRRRGLAIRVEMETQRRRPASAPPSRAAPAVALRSRIPLPPAPPPVPSRAQLTARRPNSTLQAPTYRPPPGAQLGSAAAFVGLRLQGEIAKWKGEWGWISCHRFADNVFAHQDDLGMGVPVVGSQVWFTVGHDQKGRLRALEIAASEGTRAGGHPKRRAATSPAPTSAAKKTKLVSKQSKSAANSGLADLEGATAEGEVRSWKSPWGWITSSQFDGDLFAHQDDVVDEGIVDAGQLVSFTVAHDAAKGRWRARDITRI